ncbi:hypothetical protein C2E20_5721 [Micractinium conductrix]|uniref:Uncharacterized protein n=1 Tax=Micractinium conductrix TaxID=554055 RepID=A0A2P6VA08_9CHLO|nr:hypothetical protein C2E20_5721 [Micractinium conductrix]|eukprot:PSC70908.1 hypothetical protein C2E20_5721 [Micractinium conductrix]
MLAQTLCSPAGATRALARSSRPAHSRGGTITASRARHEPPTAPGVQRAPAAAVAAARPRRELHRRRVPTAAGGQGGSLDEDEARERRFVRALLLAYFASQNRSLFAAKCMAEVVIQMYREGVTVDDVKVALSLAGLQHGGQLLSPVDEDVLVSWVAVIMMALQMVGVPLLPQGEERRQRREADGGGAEDTSGMGMGLQGLVRISVDKFLAGTDLFRLQLQQSMAGQMEGDPEAAGESPAVRVLQQNTRLVILTLEVVRDMGLPTVVPLNQPPAPMEPEEEGAEEGAAAAAAAQEQQQQQQQQQQLGGQRPPVGLAPGFMLACDPDLLGALGSADEPQRAAAVRLLISFMGAALGWQYSAWDFVDAACECYRKGWTADDVFGRLQDEEFAQSGGVGQLKVARLPGTSSVTAALLTRWLSLVYMTLAQLRVAFPGASQQDGWAWVSGSAERHGEGESTTLEAYGLADFVLHTIRNAEAREQEERGTAAGGPGGDVSSSGGSGGSGAGSEEEGERPLLVEGLLLRNTGAWVQRPQEGFVRLEDPSLMATSPTTLVMSQQISLVQMTRQLVVQERARAALLPSTP